MKEKFFHVVFYGSITHLPSVKTYDRVLCFSLGRLTLTVKEGVLPQGRVSIVIYCHNLYLTDRTAQDTPE